jgi:predicted alpha/beta hydrolase
MEPQEPLLTDVTTNDGTLLRVVEYGTPSAIAASIVFLPALGVPIGYYHRLLTEWATSRHIVALEMRGMPQSPVVNVRRADHGYASTVHQDVPALLRFPSLLSVPATVLVGHSLGGQIALLAAAAGYATPRAIVAIGSGTSGAHAQPTPMRRLIRSWQILTVDAVSSVLGYWPGDRFGFAGRQPRRMMRDWAYEARTGRYRFSGDSFDYEEALSQLNMLTLLISLPDDELITKAAVNHLAKRIRGSDIYALSRIEGQITDHFTWARSTPGHLIHAVESWLKIQAL